MIIVQLGSNKGNDKLTEYIKNNNINLELGLFVEAVPFHIDELKECYKDTPNSIIENVAIKLPGDNENEMVIHYHLDDGPKYEVASFDKNHILKHHTTDKIESIKIPSMTLEEILDKHNITKIDWLLIDVEGLDAEIVETFNWNKYDIKRVDVEHIHWGNKREYLFEKFYKMGYKLTEAKDNIYDVEF
jgi:FkbM family methyltransferase